MAELPTVGVENAATTDDAHFAVAIDFGTAGTGFAFSTFVNPTGTHIYQKWPGLVNGTSKTPTVLLLDPDGNFEAFGKKALDKYYNPKNLKYPKRVNDYYFFRQFKMALYDLQVIVLRNCIMDLCMVTIYLSVYNLFFAVLHVFIFLMICFYPARASPVAWPDQV